MPEASAAPAASGADLRFISSALKMITDMERIGDQATDISEIVLLSRVGRYIKSWNIPTPWPALPSKW